MKVEYLKNEDINSYGNFMDEVFGYEINPKAIEKLIKNAKILVIKKDDIVVASAVLGERYEYIKNQKYYHLSYLGVLKDYRRQGLASKIFEKVEELVKENKISYIELTSGNQRRVAHYFYKSKNFKIKDTTVFVKIY